MSEVNSNSNPSISIQNGAGQAEPIMVSSANSALRLIGFLALGLVVALVWFCNCQVGLVRELSTEVQSLENRVTFLEEIVINKTVKLK